MTRLVMIGGFLGAGKTTTIARLARTYQARGQRVAIITNDHAGELVDTYNLKSQGFQVGEIPGGCFCGNVESFTSVVDCLGEQRPEVILVEPIGSCVDLAATVIRPLRQLSSGRFEIAPHCVIVKPVHAIRILSADQRGGYSPKAAYLFRKQLEEADVIAVNRIDQLAPNQVKELSQLLAEHYPTVPLVCISSKEGQGFDALVELLDQQGEFGSRLLDVDYREYQAAEAELAWLNGTFILRSEQPFEIDSVLFEIVSHLRSMLSEARAETAHLKIVGLADDACAVVNLVSNEIGPEASLVAGRSTSEARIVVNARVATAPAQLTEHVRRALELACSAHRIQHREFHFQCFSPGQPAAPVLSISIGGLG